MQTVCCYRGSLRREEGRQKKTISSGTGSNRLPLSSWQFWWSRNPSGVRMSSVICGDLLIYLFLFCSLKWVNCTLSLLTVGLTFLNKPRQILVPLQPKQTINRTCMCKFFSSFLIQILIHSLKKCDCWEVSTTLVFSFQVRQKKYSNLLADRHCLAPHWPLCCGINAAWKTKATFWNRTASGSRVGKGTGKTLNGQMFVPL